MSASNDTANVIAMLASDMKLALEQKSASVLVALEERRHQLLARHLGFEPARPIKPVYVLGDSHTLFFAGEDGMSQIKHRRVGFWRPRYITRGLDLLRCFQTRHLGPATAWRAFEYGSSTRSREKIDALVRHELRPGDRVLLSFGEIDCRCHIPKFSMAGQSVARAARETITRFLSLATDLQARGLVVAAWGPAMVAANNETIAGNPLMPIGSFALRSEVTRVYCDLIKESCAAQKIPCVCLAGTYHDWNEPAAPEFFCDGFHLSQRLMPRALQALLDSGGLSLQTNTAMPTTSVVRPN